MFRIIKREMGYVVEVKFTTFSCLIKKEQWRPYICYRGSKDVFHFKTYEIALKHLLIQVKETTIKNK